MERRVERQRIVVLGQCFRQPPHVVIALARHRQIADRVDPAAARRLAPGRFDGRVELALKRVQGCRSNCRSNTPAASRSRRATESSPTGPRPRAAKPPAAHAAASSQPQRRQTMAETPCRASCQHSPQSSPACAVDPSSRAAVQIRPTSTACSQRACSGRCSVHSIIPKAPRFGRLFVVARRAGCRGQGEPVRPWRTLVPRRGKPKSEPASIGRVAKIVAHPASSTVDAGRRQDFLDCRQSFPAGDDDNGGTNCAD